MMLVRRLVPLGTALAFLLVLTVPGPTATAATTIERDPGFGGDGTVAIEWARSDELRLAVDGSRRVYAGETGNRVHRFRPGGAVDTGWGYGGVSPYRTYEGFTNPGEIDLLPGGGLFMPSMTDSSNYEIFEHGYELIKLTGEGRPDRSFGGRGLVGFSSWSFTRTATATATRPDGKVLVTGGEHTLAGRAARARLALLRPDGTPATNFARKGVFRLSANGRGYGRLDNMLIEFTDVVALANGHALVTGVMGNRFVVTRVNRKGRQVRSFGGGDGLLTVHYGGMSGIASASYFGSDAEMKMHRSPDGKWFYVLVQGDNRRNKVIAFDRRGRLKKNFGEGGVAAFGRRAGRNWRFRGTAMEILPGGRLVVAGAGGPGRKVMVLLNRDGTVDESFGDEGYLDAETAGLKAITDLEPDRRGGLIAAGDPLDYVEPPPGDEYDPGDPTHGWISRFVVR
jgi:hypothetical protein